MSKKRQASHPSKRVAAKPAAGRAAAGRPIELRLVGMVPDGAAVGRHVGQMLHVDGGIPGETVRVKVVSTGQRFGRAQIVGVLQRSPYRVQPACKHFGVCGGCAWQHIEYSQQLRFKEKMLRDTLQAALGKTPPPIAPMIGMDEIWGTRNRVHFVITKAGTDPALGHYAAHSRQVIAIDECPVHHCTGNLVARAVCDQLGAHGVPVYDERRGTGIARHVLARVSGSTGQAQVMLVAARADFAGVRPLPADLRAAQPALKGVHLNLNPTPGVVVLGRLTRKLAGDERLDETVAGVTFRLSPTSFFQTSAAGATRLAETVLRLADRQGCNRVLDLYAGVGLFALPLARAGKQVVAVEENPTAVADAAESIACNKITGCQFESGKIERSLRRLVKEPKFDLVILDPPREGCPDWALRIVARDLAPPAIIDVSCDPAALARDLQVLTRADYRIVEIQPIDMFPHTAHIETVVLLERK